MTVPNSTSVMSVSGMPVCSGGQAVVINSGGDLACMTIQAPPVNVTLGLDPHIFGVVTGLLMVLAFFAGYLVGRPRAHKPDDGARPLFFRGAGGYQPYKSNGRAPKPPPSRP